MDGYTKLHAVILDSSIWGEPMHVRIVWITMLAMADATGHCEASIGGLARRAQVTHEQCAEALALLEAPDPDSRDGTTGERINNLGGGVWFVINHAKYRERQTRRQALDAERKRVTRANASEEEQTQTQTHTQSPRMSADIADMSAPVSVKAKAKKVAVARPDDVPDGVWGDWQAVRRAKRAGPVTATVMRNMAAQAKLAHLTLAQAIEECAARGWQAFKADWLKKGFQKPEGKSHAIVQVQHKSNLDLGDPGCDCLSCRAVRRDGASA